MARTPWTQASSLPSDRIKPKAQQTSNKGKKGKNKEAGPVKSLAVRRLERMISDLQSSVNKDTPTKTKENPCFCQARVHALSPYTPICTSCGLIICILTPPHVACMHCTSSLLTPFARDELIIRLRQEVEDTLKREAEEEARLREEAQAREGAFPLLGSSTPQAVNAHASSIYAARERARAPPVAQQVHKVLSLSGTGKGKAKKVTISSYTPSPPASRTATPGTSTPEEEIDEFKDVTNIVPGLSREVRHAHLKPPGDRPWLDMHSGVDSGGPGRTLRLAYVPDPDVVRERLKAERKAKKAREKAEKAKQEKEASGGATGISETENKTETLN